MSEPIAKPLRKTLCRLKDKLKCQIEYLMADDVIKRDVGPFVCVMKNNGEIRLTIDMRRPFCSYYK